MKRFSRISSRMIGGPRTRRASAHKPTARFRPQLEMFERRDLLSTLTVINNLDSGTGSLRAEISAANSGDTIAFSQKLKGQTITLTSGELVVNQDLDIDGLGAQRLAVSGDGTSRVFDVSGGATVTLSGLTVAAGTADVGGGIMNEAGATLYISQCTLTGNQALGGASGNAQGGAIFNAAGAKLSVSQSLLAGNQASAINLSFGGAVYNQGTATIVSSQFTSNQAEGSDTSFDNYPQGVGGNLGGAIMNDDGATMTVSKTSFDSNEASGASGGDALGGAIDNESSLATTLGVTVTVTKSTFTNNEAITGTNVGNGFQGAFGGAIEDLAGTTITVTGCKFTGNQAIALPPATTFGSSYVDGGAIDNGASAFSSSLDMNLTVDACSFANNSASGGQGLAPGFGNFAYGGAVCWNLFDGIPGRVSFGDSSFTGNEAIGEPATDGAFGPGVGGLGLGGAIFAASTLSVTNCALTNNQAIGGSADGRAGYGEGGAIDAYGGLTVTNCTLTCNRAIGGGGGSNPGAPYGLFSGFADGGAISVGDGFGSGATFVITDSTLSGNQAIGGASGSGVGGWATGGGIEAYYFAVTLEDSTLVGNAAFGGQGASSAQGGDAAGGGLDVGFSATASLIDSTLSHNSVTGGEGGSGGSGGAGLGGAIAVGFPGFLSPAYSPDGSSLSLSDSTLMGNEANGGAGSAGGNGGNALGGGLAVVGEDTATVGDSMLTSNEAEGGNGANGGYGGNGFGGGIYVDSGSSTSVAGSKITRNQAIGGSSDGAGSDGQGIGGGVYYLGTFTFDHATTISKNHASTSNDDIFPS